MSRRMEHTARGFTLLELMIVVAVIGLLASVAVVAYTKHMRKAQTTEAPMNLKKIFDGARAYFEAGPRVRRNGKVVPHRFPRSTALTPKKRCCRNPGGYCQHTDWENATWQALGFEISDPHRFQYRFRSRGRDQNARFTAGAYADLDCDNRRSTYERVGWVDSQLRVTGARGIYVARGED